MNQKKLSQHIGAASAQILLLVLAVFLCAAGAQANKKIPPAAPLDLNSATSAQLAQLPGIGPAAAQSIVEFRTKSGPFRRVEDLLSIRGINQRKLDGLRPYVTVASGAGPKAQLPKKSLGLSGATGGAESAGCE